MKTLDEVIAELEDEGVFADALHYLREYRNCGDCAYADSYLRCTQDSHNDPLTWDELKQMFHKPVWIETKTKKCWVIINNFEAVTPNSENVNVIHTSHRGAKYSHFARHLMGQTWQAYRKEKS